MEIVAWLQAIGLSQYAQNFHDHHVDEALLPSLTAQDLSDIGVASVGHRRLILNAISALSKGPSGELQDPRPQPNQTVIQQNLGTGERRPVTVLFADLCGFTRLSEELEDEALHALLAGYFSMAEEAIKANAGTVDKQIGDAVMGVFGVPIARDGDTANAARAALAIQDGMSALTEAYGRSLQAHLGLAAGEAIVSGVAGAPLNLIGASVNLAARVTAAAQPDEVLVSDTLARQLSTQFQLEDRGSFAAKGFSEPVHVWRLIAETLDGPPAYPFVGRKAELGQIEALLRGAVASKAGVLVHIRGEPGIGKSRLVERAVEIAREAGFASIVARALDFGIGHARHPLRMLSSALLGFDAGMSGPSRSEAVANALPELKLDPAAESLLSELTDAELPDEQRALLEALSDVRRRGLRNEVVRALVRRRALKEPLLLAVEDVQWADDELTAAIMGILSITQDHPVAILTTSRLDDERFYASLRDARSRTPLITLDLGPLRLDEAEQFARDASVPDDVRKRCLERAAGNPLFLDQLLRNADELVRTDLPASLRGLILARIDRLSVRDKDVIQAASALGERFHPDALGHVLGKSQVELAQLTRAGMLRESGEDIAFGHALIRDAAYRSLLRETRQTLHRRAANWFDDRDLILHAVHLKAAEAPEAASAYGRAAEDRLARYRTSEALDLVRIGLGLDLDGAYRSELTLLKAKIGLELGHAREAAATFRESLSLGLAPSSECTARIGLAAALRILDDGPGALDQLEAAQQLAVQNDWPALLSQCHHLRGNLLFPTGRVEECCAEHQLALQMAEQAGDPEATARALGGLGDAEYVRGRIITAGGYFRRSVEAGVRAGLGRVEAPNRPMMALATFFELRLADALREAHVAIERARLMTQPRAELIGRHACALALVELGRDDEALAHLKEAQRITRELEAWRFEGENLTQIAEIHLRGGQFDEARAAIETAIRIARETGMAYFGSITLAVLARTEQDPQAREKILAETEALLSTVAVSHNHWLGRRQLIELGWELRDPQMVEFQASALETYGKRESGPYLDAIIRRGRILARTLRHDQSTDLADEIAHLKAVAENCGSALLKLGLDECEATLSG
jgi:class 3 adenylate cyclase/tetratricopeptide (TPR) repeat protein